MYWKTDRQKQKELDAAVAERKAREKNEAWIKELEAKDQEEREHRAKEEAVRMRVMEGRGRTWRARWWMRGRGGRVSWRWCPSWVMAGEGDTMQVHMDTAGWSFGLSCIGRVKKENCKFMCGRQCHSLTLKWCSQMSCSFV
jgi:hypothetical protein